MYFDELREQIVSENIYFNVGLFFTWIGIVIIKNQKFEVKRVG